MLLTCLFCAALHMPTPAPALRRVQHVITVSPSSSEGETGLSAEGMTQDQGTAMRLYADTADKARDTAIEAFGGAAKAQAAGYADLAEKDLRLARHGVANVAIARAELISGRATLAHPRDHAATLAQYHAAMARERAEAARMAGAATDDANRRFHETLAGYLARVDADPGRYASTGGAEALTGEGG